MISTWSEWKRYPRAGRGENIEAPITPGIYEVRFAGTGALHSFGAVDNVAQALSLLPVGTQSWFCRRETSGQRRRAFEGGFHGQGGSNAGRAGRRARVSALVETHRQAAFQYFAQLV